MRARMYRTTTCRAAGPAARRALQLPRDSVRPPHSPEIVRRQPARPWRPAGPAFALGIGWSLWPPPRDPAPDGPQARNGRRRPSRPASTACESLRPGVARRGKTRAPLRALTR
ncbi:MAG: hypothetical protein WKG07_01005 [Hymenobacter sp.]